MKLLFLFLTLALPTLSVATTEIINAGEKVTLSYTLSAGTGPFTHVWTKDWVHIPDATEATYIIPAFKSTDVGTYRVKITNKAGSAVSDDAVLKLTIIAPTAPVLKTVREPAPTLP